MALANLQNKTAHAVDSTHNTLAFTWNSNTGTGNLIVIGVSTTLNTRTVSSIADSQGNTYVKAVAEPVGTSQNVEIWYAKNITGGTTPTVTVTVSSAGTFTIGGYEYSGADTVSPFDKSSGNTANNTTPTSLATATLSQANEVAVGVACNSASTATYTAGSGFGNILNDHGTAAGTNSWFGMEDQIVAATTGLAATFTQSATGQWGAAVATFKASTGTVFTSSLTATLSFTGVFNKAITHLMTAAVSFAGAILKNISHLMTATLSFIGSIIRTIAHKFAGALSFTGTMAAGHVFVKAFTAAVSFTGTLSNRIFHLLTAALSFTGTLVKATSKVMTAATSFVGTLQRSVAHGLTASLSFTGKLIHRTAKSVSASLSFVGNLSLHDVFFRTFTAAVSFAGVISKSTSKKLTGGVSFTGAIKRTMIHLLSGILSFSGNVVKKTTHKEIGGLSFAGAFALGLRFFRTFTAALSFTGSIKKQMTKKLTAAVSFVGAFTKGAAHFLSFTGTLSFTGAMTKMIKTTFSALLSFTAIFAAHVPPIWNSLTNKTIDTTDDGAILEDYNTQTIETGDTIEDINTPNTTGNLSE